MTEHMEMGWRPMSDTALEQFYKALAETEDSITFMIEATVMGNRPVGTCGLYALNLLSRRAEFRIFIGDDAARGKGIGTNAARLILHYAFQRLGLHRVELGVRASNAPAIRSYENAGFVKEGTRKDLIFDNGTFHDALMMRAIAEDYVPGLATTI